MSGDEARAQLEARISFPAELVEVVVQEVVARIRRSGAEPSSLWLGGAQAAADYLGWPKSRVDKQIRSMPHYRQGGRLMFRRDELDAWLDGFYEGPPRHLELPDLSRIRR